MEADGLGPSASRASGVALSIPGEAPLPVSRAGCIAAARAVAGEARGHEPSQVEAWWASATNDAAIAAWSAATAPAPGERLAGRLAAALIPAATRTCEADLLLDLLGIVADRDQASERLAVAVAEERFEAARELAYGAGHEINNPLANIATRAQSLLPGEADPERRRRLSIIVDQAFRARDMIGGLMVYARPPRAQPEMVGLDALVRVAVEAVRGASDARGVRLHARESPMTLSVVVDAAQVGEALRALAVNALEAVDDGGRVEIETSSGSDGMHRIVIKDDGRGLDAESARRAFDPFYSGREAGRGIGLGLPKALRLIEGSGGTVAMHSKPAGGTHVVVDLPAAPALT